MPVDINQLELGPEILADEEAIETTHKLPGPYLM